MPDILLIELRRTSFVEINEVRGDGGNRHKRVFADAGRAAAMEWYSRIGSTRQDQKVEMLKDYDKRSYRRFREYETSGKRGKQRCKEIWGPN